MEQHTTLFLQLVLLGLSVLCVIASAWFARKNNVRELTSDVDEIASVVEKIYRESKRQQMRRVREAAGDSDIPRPPGLVDNPPLAAVTNKQALRRAVFGGKAS